jgi:hypothetical protein
MTSHLDRGYPVPPMASPLTTMRRFASRVAGVLRPASPPVRVNAGTQQASQGALSDLAAPGQFKTTRGEVFRHGVDLAEDHGNLTESRWIAFDGVRLRVSLYEQKSGEKNRVTFCGKDAPGCSEARDWAHRLLRSNGVWFPHEEAFEQFCRELGWTPESIETMLGIYR